MIFKNYSYTWWQIGVFKLALLCIGAGIGAYASEFFLAHMAWVIGLSAVSSLYVIYISLKQ
ncbi:MAG TPA: hypothetical protein PKD79_03465 [Candidatus Doudnabacteria bacterium]|nr:hypothetical protein [Candidatus Doudnabacteria bacterium]